MSVSFPGECQCARLRRTGDPSTLLVCVAYEAEDTAHGSSSTTTLAYDYRRWYPDFVHIPDSQDQAS